LTDSHSDPKDVDEVNDSAGANTANIANVVEESTSSSLSDLKQNRQENAAGRAHTYHSLVPLPEQVQRQRSAPRAIPSSTKVISTHHPPIGSQPSSAGSTGSAFLNNIFNNGHLSHTPPTHVSTSYESSHFGKRARSGVSIDTSEQRDWFYSVSQSFFLFL
jgi:hypothetical protein